MFATVKALFLAVLVAASFGTDAFAAKRTVCTITVNSPDEKEMFRHRLPADQYEFVELVERGRSDWLDAACRQGVRCDVLVISGHFDGTTEFYSDRVGTSEFLPVAEMERASCSASCPALFSQLKEVYLFGCNTLNADATKGASAEVERSLVRGGHSQAEAQRRARDLDKRHAESSRDRMRRIFVNVPVIYGFSSVAPLGPTAASLLGRYLQPSSLSEVGNGKTSGRLLSQFAAESMMATGGLSEADPHAAYRREVCRFIDDRPAAAEKLDFVHDLLRRDMVEVRMFLERIEALFASFRESERQTPAFASALDRIAGDTLARERYLRFAKDADQPAIRARMINLAAVLGWLPEPDRRAELARLVGDLLARKSVDDADIGLVCSLNQGRELDQERVRLAALPEPEDSVAHAAVLACLGSDGDRQRVLYALTSHDEADVRAAQVYLGYQPIVDVDELRDVANRITRMTRPGAQVRALDALSRHRLSDGPSLDVLARFFPRADTVDVQRAIAAVLIRSDYGSLPRIEIASVLRQARLKSSGGEDIIDILIRRLQVPSL